MPSGKAKAVRKKTPTPKDGAAAKTEARRAIVGRLEEQVHRAVSELERLRTANVDLSQQMTTLEKGLSRLEVKENKLSEKKSALQTEKRSLLEENKELIKAQKALAKRAESLEKVNSELKEEIDRLSAVLATSEAEKQASSKDPVQPDPVPQKALEDAQKRWSEERARIRVRVESLVEGLENLLIASRSGSKSS